MQSKLSQSQIEGVSERYHDHPLLVACRQAFECYEADMQRLLFAPEEIFLEAAIIIDRLLTDPDSAISYVNGLWNALKIKIRRWEPEAPQDDLNKISGAILYVVAAVLCQHSQHFFNDDLKDKILALAKHNMPAGVEEEERVIRELSRCADGLYEWLLTYEDNDILLSEEILNSDNQNQTNMDNTGKVLEALGKAGISVAGDLVVGDKVQNKVESVASGGIGIQILNSNDTPIFKSDKEIKDALEELQKVKDEQGEFLMHDLDQWYAVFRVLSHFCGYPKKPKDFEKTMKNIGTDAFRIPCKYENFRKVTLNKLPQNVALWKQYVNSADQYSLKQIVVAIKLIELLDLE